MLQGILSLFSSCAQWWNQLVIFLQSGITSALETLPHVSPQWLSDPSRSKHAGANKHFGLRGPHKRRYVFAGEFKFPVQNERLSKHSFNRGGGKRCEGKVVQGNVHLLSVVYLSIMPGWLKEVTLTCRLASLLFLCNNFRGFTAMWIWALMSSKRLFAGVFRWAQRQTKHEVFAPARGFDKTVISSCKS